MLVVLVSQQGSCLSCE